MQELKQKLEQDNYFDESLKTMRVKRRLYTAAFILLLGVFFYFAGQLLNILATPVGIVLWATIIVFVLKGPVNALEKRGVSRMIGTTISFILMFAVVSLIAWLLFSPVLGFGEQFVAIINNIPHYISAVRDTFNDMYSQYAHILQDERVSQWVNEALAALSAWANKLAQSTAEGVVVIGSGLANAMLVIGFALVVAFWILLELPAMGREVKRLAGPKYQQDLNVFYITGTRVMGGYIKATLIQCLIIGVLSGIGYGFMGIPSAAALGVITGLLNIIPVVGPWLGGAIAAIMGIFVSPLIAVIALIYVIIVQQIIYTFVSPKIMSNSVDIHPALVILALMIGSAIGFATSGFMGSFVGALLSIPAVAFFKSIFVYYFEKRHQRVIVSPDGVIFKGEPSESEIPNPIADATGELFIPPDTFDKQ